MAVIWSRPQCVNPDLIYIVNSNHQNCMLIMVTICWVETDIFISAILVIRVRSYNASNDIDFLSGIVHRTNICLYIFSAPDREIHSMFSLPFCCCERLNFVHCHLNTLRPRKNGRHFADDIFKCIFLNENIWIPIKISLKFVPKGSINNIPSLVQIMAWRRPGDKPSSEPMMARLLTHIYVTRPQWVNQNDYLFLNSD